MAQMVKESANNAGDLCLTPGSGRSPGEGNGYLIQYSFLENSLDRGSWCTIVHGVAIYGCESWIIKIAEYQKSDAFKCWWWRRLLRLPWTAERSN